MLSFIIIFFVIMAIIAFVGIIFDSKKHSSTTSSMISESVMQTTNRRPKISAEVTESFNEEVQSYCRKNSMTVSEFIRKSAKYYMEHNQ